MKKMIFLVFLILFSQTVVAVIDISSLAFDSSNYETIQVGSTNYNFCKSDVQICDCEEVYCNSHQAKSFLFAKAAKDIYESDGTSGGLSDSSPIDRDVSILMYGTYTPTIGIGIYELYPFRENPQFFDKVVPIMGTSTDFEPLSVMINTRLITILGQDFLRVSLNGINTFDGKIRFRNTKELLVNKEINTPKDYISIVFDFGGNPYGDLSNQIILDAQSFKNFFEVCEDSLTNYVEENERLNYCKSVFNSAALERAIKVNSGGLKQNFFNQSKSVSQTSKTNDAPIIPQVTPPVGDLQQRINTEVQEYYECFIDETKCGGMPTNYRTWTDTYGGKCESYLLPPESDVEAKFNYYDEVQLYSPIIEDKSVTPEDPAKANVLPSMKPSLTKAFITVENAPWIPDSFNSEESDNILKYSYGLMQVSGINLKDYSNSRLNGLPDYFGSGSNPGSQPWIEAENNIARGTTVYRDKVFAISSRLNCQDMANIVLPNLLDIGLDWPETLSIASYNGGVVDCDPGSIASEDATQYAIAVLAWAKIFEQNSCEIEATPTEVELKASLDSTKSKIVVGEKMEMDTTGSSTGDGISYKITIKDFVADDSTKTSSKKKGDVFSGNQQNKIEVILETKDGDLGKWTIELEVSKDGKTPQIVTKIIEVVAKGEEQKPIASCEDSDGKAVCSNVLECLACIDYKFLTEVFD